MAERAITDYAGIMADAGFPLNHDLLREIAQSIVNEQGRRQRSQGGTNVGTGSRPTQRLQRQGAIPPPSASDPATTNPHIHIVGANWVDRFLNCNSGFKKVYIRYEERARKAATNDC